VGNTQQVGSDVFEINLPNKEVYKFVLCIRLHCSYFCIYCRMSPTKQPRLTVFCRNKLWLCLQMINGN